MELSLTLRIWNELCPGFLRWPWEIPMQQVRANVIQTLSRTLLKMERFEREVEKWSILN